LKMMMMMRDFSLRYIVQNWDAFEKKKRRYEMKENKEENERTSNTETFQEQR